MKQYIEHLIRKYLTSEYYIKGQPDPIAECPSFEYNEYTQTIKFYSNIPPYKMVILRRIIKAYEIPIENIIVGTPMI